MTQLRASAIGASRGWRPDSGQYFERDPFPDPDRWQKIADPAERLQTGLHEMYAYHAATEAVISHALADARDHPVMAPYHAHWQHAADILSAPWRLRSVSPSDFAKRSWRTEGPANGGVAVHT